eukprot:GCRY01000302.1.p1 GENE.GCRY01000302.1~~GCRY01000302.1.p1  ORF type:complete len:398 (-),score=105.49 GCRY01000302.1:61-1185(-)
MLWFLTLTQSCNMCCKYCGSDETFEEDIEDLSPHPKELTFSPKLYKVLGKDPEPVICFYGGEPLLQMRLFKTIMTDIPHAKYCLQTNAKILDKLPTDVLTKFETVLVSIDGDEEATARNRGAEAYDNVVSNSRDARERGFEGDLVARMAVSDGSNIYDDVMHLINLDMEEEGKPLFDHVHWQLDVLWDSPKFARWEDFLGWRENNYNPGITRLADEFVRELQNGRVLGIAPFLALLNSYMKGEKVKRIRCGSGATSFNISTGGDITACPIAPEFDSLATISEDFDPLSVKDSVLIGGPCLDCEVLEECGGRCLYGNKTSWWGEDGFAEVCVTVKHLLAEMKRILPAVESAVANGLVPMAAFEYPPFNNSVEIIP